jgi:uncharacterized protein (DUF58 family)
MLASLNRNLTRRTRAWARRRHRIAAEPFVLPGRRIYILPTGLGLAFSIMVFAMFLGAMNYANNLALGLSFLLGALGFVAMHHCHRNLAGVRIATAGSEPAFATERARFRISVENAAALTRYGIAISNDHGVSQAVHLGPAERAVLELSLPATRRGLLELDQFEVSTGFPFGLFRAWSHVHLATSAVVYPRLAPSGRTPPPTETDTGGAQEGRSGEEDFAGLRSFQAGDSPSRIAWKAYAREDKLVTRLYSGTAVFSHSFDWHSLHGLDTETRLSQLARWIEDASAQNKAFSLRLPGEVIPTNIGPAHRHRCLTALALFPGDARG